MHGLREDNLQHLLGKAALSLTAGTGAVSCGEVGSQPTASRLRRVPLFKVSRAFLCGQEAGGSENDIQLAVARAHERMLQAELAESQAPAPQAGPSDPQQPQPPPARGGRAPAEGSRAASSRQAAQVRALNRQEVCERCPLLCIRD